MEKITYTFIGSYLINFNSREGKFTTKATSYKSALNNIKYQIRNENGFNFYVQIALYGDLIATFRDSYLTFHIKDKKVEYAPILNQYLDKKGVPNELQYFHDELKEALDEEEMQKMWEEHQRETLGIDFDDYD